MKPPHVVLIQPWIEDFAAYDFWIQPLGLLRLASYLRWSGCTVTLIDCLNRTHPEMKPLIKTQNGRDLGDGRGNFYKSPLPKPTVVNFVPRHFSRYGISQALFEEHLDRIERPDLMCLTSGMTYWYPALETTRRILHLRWPHVPQVVGGISATLQPDFTETRFPGLNVFPGPLGADFHHYLQHVFPRQKMVRAADVPFQKFMFEPDYGLLNDRHSISLETSHGCPYRCSYCATGLSAARLTQFPAAAVLRLLNLCRSSFGTRHIAFYDDALFYKPSDHIKPLLRSVLEHNFQFKFHTPNGLFPRFIDAELAALMVKTGFSTIRLSLDTMSPVRQKQMGKLEPSHLTRAFQNLSEAGFPRRNIEVYLLIGLPGQKAEEVERGLEFVARLGGISRLAQFSPVPGTIDWQKAIEFGIIKPDSDPLFFNPTVYAFLNPHLPFAEYLTLKKLTEQLNREIRADNIT